MASSNNPFGGAAVNDDFDMNNFIDFDQGFHNSPSPTNAKLEPRQSLDPSQLILQQSRQQYNGPSHNYDQFRQQTGLPLGSVSHVHAVNQFSNSNHIKPTNFGAAHFQGYNTGFDIGSLEGQELDGSQAFLAPEDSNMDEFAVDPSAIAPDSQPPAAFRVWPGMHSQQAKQQAKDQADTKQKRHDEAMNSQQQLPSNFEQTYGGRSRSATASEPHMNEQISRLLNQMRQNSAASLDDDDESKGDMSGVHSLSYTKKPEEDMDEDERLLASEEGKKLSSKERRQLRNKVSARAFRSRRKEYITQLEGEVAAKTNECNDMKITNRRLLEQNRQLTQLCKTMLNHPAFNTFMDEMSNDPSLLNAFAPSQSSSRSDSQPSQTPEQPQPVQSQQQQQPPPPPPPQQQQQQQNVTQVGMSMMPDTPLNFSMLNLGGNHWNNGTFQQPQIFAVHELPLGPSLAELQSSVLSGKTEDGSEEVMEEKADVPGLKELPRISSSTREVGDDVSDVDEDPTFALYIDAPVSSIAAPEPTLEQALNDLEHSLSEKGTTFNLRVYSPDEESLTVRAVDRLFARSQPTLRRIELATRHLPL